MTLLNRLKNITWCCVLFIFLGSTAYAASNEGPIDFTITNIKIDQTADDFYLTIEGESPPTYTMYELFDPLRIILDVAGAAVGKDVALPANLPQGPIQELKTVTLDDQKPAITRIEVYLAEDRGYAVERQGNSIVVSFAKDTSAGQEEMGMAPAAPSPTMEQVPEAVASQQQATVLYDIEVDTTNPNNTLVFIKTDGPVHEFQKAQLAQGAGRPDRMYIDIPNLSLPGKMLQQTVGTALAKIRAAQRKDAVRIVFDSALDKLFDYSIEQQADGVLVTIHEPSAATPILAKIIDTQEKESSSLPSKSEIMAEELIIPKIIASKPGKVAQKAKEREKKTTPQKVEPKKQTGPTDTFGFAGYDKQKITVDFFKIDLHNVFRLFGEISGQNIVVDEAVKGSLTIALNDVPWNFALDIILNLKDLQKEERFNTIVISPKSKQFQWPKTASDKIEFKADGTSGPGDSISVKQRLETPVETIEAKKLIKQANIADKAGQYEKALQLYEGAFKRWPENAELASRISALCLVQLGMNAKSVYYAKAALALEPENTNAALQAAIALANMKKIEEAKKYFDAAIATDRAASEALVSYASFAEEYKSYQGALALLKKHEQLYGDTLDTLIAKARIFDKMGNTPDAITAYNAVLLSGFEIPEDLRQFIQGRIAAAQ